MDKSKLTKYTGFFLDGKLSGEQEKELLFWIKQDDSNRKRFLEEQEKQSLILKKNGKTKQVWKSIHHKIFGEIWQRKQCRFLVRAASVAAAFILGAIFAVTISDYIPMGDNNKITQQNIYVPFGAKTKIVLPDSSCVWLNSGSSFSYPSEFGKVRSVQLTGEAFFEVTKSGNPFVVSTNFGDIEVKGTSFNVQAFSGETFLTTLERGSVLVREKVNRKEVTLRPGQQALLDRGRLSVKSVETDLYTSWKEGKLIFRKEYLPAVVKRLERWYNMKIVLDDDSRLDKIWFNGTLEMESFTEVMDLLKLTSPIEYSYNHKTRTMNIKYAQKKQ